MRNQQPCPLTVSLSTLFTLLLLCLSLPWLSSAQPPSFPSAERYGSTAAGGRGGDVYIVSNLNASGTGSFYEAITDVTYTVEWSDDLTNWRSAGITSSVLTGGAKTQQIKAWVPAGVSRRFVHLKVTRP